MSLLLSHLVKSCQTLEPESRTLSAHSLNSTDRNTWYKAFLDIHVHSAEYNFICVSFIRSVNAAEYHEEFPASVRDGDRPQPLASTPLSALITQKIRDLHESIDTRMYKFFSLNSLGTSTSAAIILGYTGFVNRVSQEESQYSGRS
jgi:hypothetical protein